MTSSLKFKITEYFLAVFASSFGVTEEDCLSEAAVWSTLFLLNVSTALKGTHNYIFICWFFFGNSAKQFAENANKICHVFKVIVVLHIYNKILCIRLLLNSRKSCKLE